MTVLDQAIAFATKAHEGQKRKYGNIPYILHPLEVASIIATMTDDIEVMAAGVLHDTIEDCGVEASALRSQFGDRVTDLVLSETEESHNEEDACASWMRRKEGSLRVLAASEDRGVKILWLADKLANVRAFVRETEASGLSPWRCLHQSDPAKQQWYYETIASLTAELSDTFAYREFIGHLGTLFGKTSICKEHTK